MSLLDAQSTRMSKNDNISSSKGWRKSISVFREIYKSLFNLEPNDERFLYSRKFQWLAIEKAGNKTDVRGHTQ